MRIGEKGIEIQKYFESIHDGDLSKIWLQPKMDCSGIWTEGYGHAILHNGKFLRGAENEELANKLSTIHTVTEAEMWLYKDNDIRAVEVEKKLRVSLNQNQFDALLSFYYNAGYSSTIFTYINKGTVFLDDLIKFWTTHYIRSDGVIYNGLIKRRCTEAHLYKTGKVDFEAWKQFYDKLR